MVQIVGESVVVRKQRRAWRRVIGLLAGLVFAGIAVVLVARQVGPEAWLWPFIIALTPWLLIPAAAGLVLAIVARSWVAFAGLAITGLLVATQWPLLQSPAPSGPADLTVVSTNLRLGKAEPDAVLRAIGNADLVSMQELTPGLLKDLQAAGINDLFPHSFTRPAAGAAGTGMWSRYPLTDRGHLDGFIFEQLHATVAAPSGDFTFFAVHPVTPGNPRLWAGEQRLLQHALGAGPVIVAGDFNATRDHRQFRAYTDIGFIDASVAAGAARRRTFATTQGPLPTVAIDHVLTRGTAYTPDWVSVTDLAGSDHRALTAGFRTR